MARIFSSRSTALLAIFNKRHRNAPKIAISHIALDRLSASIQRIALAKHFEGEPSDDQQLRRHRERAINFMSATRRRGLPSAVRAI